jgi:hypothetical protein
MHTARLRRWAHGGLLVVTIFNALSAVGGGIAVLATNGLGMPRSLLAGGPFTSFAWPGMILLVVVGGTQAIAVTTQIARATSSLLWTAIAGFGMVIWIFVETGIIAGISWPQASYFATGLLQLTLVLALLGISRLMPRPLAVAG